jgi:hypothetical protein
MNLSKELSKLLNERAASIRSTRKIATLKQHKLAALGKMLGKHGYVADVNVSTWSDNTASISTTVSIRDLDGFKDPKLAKLLGGLVALSTEVREKEYPSNLNRDYFFEWVDTEGDRFYVNVYAYARPDSPTCRKVLVGVEEKLVREEKYEIVCD